MKKKTRSILMLIVCLAALLGVAAFVLVQIF
jgi:hypothetical protein